MQLSKVLLASTALMGVSVFVAQGAFADGHSSVGVSGFVNFEAMGGDLEEKQGAGTENFDFQTDSEVHVKYKTTDEESGLSYGATVEFETDTNQTGNTDEAYVFISGGFGEVRLGNEDGAADNMKVGGFSNAAGTGGIDGDGSVGSAAIAIGNSSDDTKIRYDSPVVGGFQLGISFTPRPGTGSDAAANSGYENYFEGGLVYSGSFSGLDIKASGVFGVNSGENGNEDFEGFGVGAQIGFSGFSLAGGFFTDEDNTGAERDIINVGIAGDLGPASVSLGYNLVDPDNSNLEESNIVASATVGLLPGVSFKGDISFFDEDLDTGDDGVSGVGRLAVSF